MVKRRTTRSRLKFDVLDARTHARTIKEKKRKEKNNQRTTKELVRNQRTYILYLLSLALALSIHNKLTKERRLAKFYFDAYAFWKITAVFYGTLDAHQEDG